MIPSTFNLSSHDMTNPTVRNTINMYYKNYFNDAGTLMLSGITFMNKPDFINNIFPNAKSKALEQCSTRNIKGYYIHFIKQGYGAHVHHTKTVNNQDWINRISPDRKHIEIIANNVKNIDNKMLDDKVLHIFVQSIYKPNKASVDNYKLLGTYKVETADPRKVTFTQTIDGAEIIA